MPLHIFRSLCQLPRRVNRPGFLPALILLFLLAVKSPAALDVGKPLWGFDGKVPPSSFALLSIEVVNRGAKAFEGDIELSSGGSGAPLKQSVFLAPGSSRVVQFHPYMGNYVPDWKLSWNDGRDEAENLGQPQSGPPATVLLGDPDAPGTRAARMRLFAENLFPTTVGATDGLGAVVLDHQPHWDATRREAFLDWLRRGGTVHLLPGADGAAVQFSDDFAQMNIAVGAKQKHVGAGLVVKHDITRAEITEQWLKDHGFAQPELRTDGKGNIHDADSFVFRRLAAITRPNINWGLIYLLTVAYVILIGPVFYLQRKRNYRLLLGGFLLTVGLFAWAFTVIGRRGYGEKQIYHSIAIARPLGEGRFDVQEWIHAFATTGDIYRFSHGDSVHLYGTAPDGDSVRGEIREGKASQFAADIPLFSSRPFLHRGVMKAEDLALKVETWTAQASYTAPLKDFRVSASPELRKRVIAAVLEYQGRYATLSLIGNGFILQQNTTLTSAQDFFGENRYYDYGNFYGSQGDAESVVRELRALNPFFIGIANNVPMILRRYLSQPDRGSDHARLFLYADAPPGFAMKNDRFESGHSLVLYVADIFKP